MVRSKATRPSRKIESEESEDDIEDQSNFNSKQSKAGNVKGSSDKAAGKKELQLRIKRVTGTYTNNKKEDTESATSGECSDLWLDEGSGKNPQKSKLASFNSVSTASESCDENPLVTLQKPKANLRKRKIEEVVSEDSTSTGTCNDENGRESGSTDTLKEKRPAKKLKINSRKQRIKFDSDDSNSDGEDDYKTGSNTLNKKRNAKEFKMNSRKQRISFDSTENESDDSSECETGSNTLRKRSSAKNRSTKSARSTKASKNETNKNVGRKEIRQVLANDELTKETKMAEKKEVERRKRLEQRVDDKIVEVDLDESLPVLSQPITKRLALQKNPIVEVHPLITVNLKPHQVEGIQFIWDNLIESTSLAEKSEGGGCILAHCMGLGKTLQTIAFTHTALTSDKLSLNTVLVIGPLNTVLNWIDEYCRWMPDDKPLNLFNLAEYPTTKSRITALKRWKNTGGVMISGYDMFRLLATGTRVKHKPFRQQLVNLLLDPGPDIIVCDEGHRLKNSEAHISIVMNKVKTKRRLVLTGTPLQNNLNEYQCMVNFVKPNLLGSTKEFRNRFVNPILNGQHSDSTEFDVRLMKKRCHVLHEMLQGFVQRKDYTALAQYLCDKYEYIIKVRLTPLQTKLYRHYLNTRTNRGDNSNAIIQSTRDTGLFADYQNLLRVWTHPRVLQLHSRRVIEEMKNFITSSSEAELTDDDWMLKKNSSEEKKKSPEEEAKQEQEKSSSTSYSNRILSDVDSDDERVEKQGRNRNMKSKRLRDSEEDSSDFQCTSEEEHETNQSDSEQEEELARTRTRSKRYRLRGGNNSCSEEDVLSDADENGDMDEVDESAWYSSVATKTELEEKEAGGKIVVLFEILRLAAEHDDKVLVFSQSLLSLDLIEGMLADATMEMTSSEEEAQDGFGKWYKNVDYFRIDGSCVSKARQKSINMFNDENNRRARLFLISTKAGSLGVNLIGANRVVIFDVSWNPSHDVQSIFRVYRFGQTKSCYVYRLIAQGTMEEKIYDRQVTKQSLAFRVVDEQQINRHFTAHDLQELYTFNPPIPEEGDTGASHALPKDHLLAELLVGETTRKLISSYHQHDSLLDHQETEELTEEERKAAWEEYENEKKGQTMRSNPAPSMSHNLQLQYQQQLASQRFLLQQHFMKRQVVSQQSISFIASNFGYLPPQKQKVISSLYEAMTQAEAVMRRSIELIREHQPVDIQVDVANLKNMPMYQTFKEDTIKLVAFEIGRSRKQHVTRAQNEYKQQQDLLEMYKARFQNLIKNENPPKPAVNSHFASSIPSTASTQQNESINRNLVAQSFQPSSTSTNDMLQDASKLARKSLAEIKLQGPVTVSIGGVSTVVTIDDDENKDQSCTVVDDDKMKKNAANVSTAATKSETILVPSSDAQKSTNISDETTASVKSNQGTVMNNNVQEKKALLQPTTSHDESGVDLRNTKVKTTRRKADDNSSDEDWAIAYQKNAKSRSTRSRNNT